MNASKHSRAILALVVAVALTPWPIAAAAPCPGASPAAQRVVAVGDVHGSFDGLVEILTVSGLIDRNLHWSGGDATLVQIGDILDRGTDVRQVMDLLMRLQGESRAAGGRVLCLLGNHEAMNLLGIQRDTNPEVYAAFVDRRSETRQKEAWKQQVRVWEERAAKAGRVIVNIPEETRKGWLRAHPLGSFEYVDAVSPEGRYGRWLRSLPVAVLIAKTVFVHAGLSPTVRGLSIDELNRRAAAEVTEFEAARKALVKRRLAEPWASIEEVSLEADLEVERLARQLSEHERSKGKTASYIQTLQPVRGWKEWVIGADDGPIWSRDAADWDEKEHGAEMADLIAGVGATRMVVGHQPQAGSSIQMRFGKRVFLIDTGMLKSTFDGRPSALEICGDIVSAIYPGEREELIGPDAGAGGGGGSPAVAVGPGDREVDDPPEAAVVSATTRAPSAGSSYRWLDVNGAPLPFQDDAAIERFLATAKVVEEQTIPVGVTKPLKVVLEEDGVRAHAAFKHLDETSRYVEVKVLGRKRLFPSLHDYYLFDCAAYRLDRLFGLGRFPPAVPRTIGGRKGILEIWLEDTIMERKRVDRGLEPPDADDFAKQRQIMFVFDNIVGNTDTNNNGNSLIDRYWHVWFIDCSRCFVMVAKPLTLETVTRCDRKLWQRLHEVTDEQIRSAMEPFLNRSEIDGVIKRRAAVVRHIAGLIQRHGEAAVLFDLSPPLAEPAAW
ncbi:MAG: metallophosphoesterase [Acidobacteriota bacterium]